MRETRDLILKKAAPDDWRGIYENLWRHAESAKYMLWESVRSEEDAKARMQRTIEYQSKNPFGYFVYEKASGKAIGFAGVVKTGEREYEDTGIAVGPSFVRRGYGKQILTALADLVFGELGAERFVTSCRSGNEASRRLQISCGFAYSHSEDRVDPRNGEPYVIEFYELKRDGWR